MLKNVHHVGALQDLGQHLLIQVVVHSVDFVLTNLAESEAFAEIGLFAQFGD
jgi:hypothetical protein